ncbi:MAG: glycosyltransferase family 4 protein [Pseudonocardiaceae bacterium]
MAKLVFDVRSNHDTGVSRYGLSLLPAAAHELVAGGWELDIVAKPVQQDRARDAVTGLGHRARVHVDSQDEGFLRRSSAVHDLAARADLYYTSHYLLDRLCPVPFVVTIHDLTRLRLPQFSYSDATFMARFGPSEFHAIQRELAALAAWQDPSFAGHGTFTRYFVALNRYLTARAERVVTVSQASASELQHFLPLPADGIDVIPGGVDTTVFRPRTAGEVDAIRRHFLLSGPYLVFVGLAHPNKRLEWLVEQLLCVRERMPTTARLVAVGGHAEGSTALRRLLGRAGDDFVVFPGRVTDSQLAALYSGAAALVSASISEGYGLPVQEALSCGCEVIAADIPATRETAGSAVHRFPPTSGCALADLACSALGGGLQCRSSVCPPPSWDVAGRRLGRVLERAWRYSPRQDARIKA